MSLMCLDHHNTIHVVCHYSSIELECAVSTKGQIVQRS